MVVMLERHPGWTHQSSKRRNREESTESEMDESFSQKRFEYLQGPESKSRGDSQKRNDMTLRIDKRHVAHRR